MNSGLDYKRIFIFLAIAFGWAYTAGALIYLNGGLENAADWFGFNSFVVLAGLLYMPAPAVAHLLTRRLTGEGRQNLYLRLRFKQGWKQWVAAWLGTAVLLAVGGAAYYAVFPGRLDPTLAAAAESTGQELPLTAPQLLAVQAVAALTFGLLINVPFMLAEEFGWRAYLQQKLMPLGPRRAMLLMGVIWGVWHAPLLLMGYNYGSFSPDPYWGEPWTGIAVMCVMTTAVGTWLGWLVNRAGSVWPAVIGHGIINGLGPIMLLFHQPNTVSPLLGPAVTGILGSAGFLLVTGLLLWRTDWWAVPSVVETEASGRPQTN